MGGVAKQSIIIIVLLLFAVLGASFAYVSMAAEDNDNTLKVSTSSAMTKAINKGAVRVDEEITINPKVAEEALLREFADNSSFMDGSKKINIYKISSKPAMISVESYNTVEIPISKMLKQFNKKEEEQKGKVRDRETVIFEAKKTAK